MNGTHAVARLRMLAGPNGSGKSTMKSVIKESLLGIYINPDEIEASIRAAGFLDLAAYHIQVSTEELAVFFQKSTLLKKADLLSESKQIHIQADRVTFTEVGVNSYYASVLADFIRQKHLELSQSFTFETVMSSPDKIQFLKYAQERGFRTYLYYVATDDPIINISRVEHRVKAGGHSVPTQKIIERYSRSLDLLWEAIQYTHRAYIFDNSGRELLWLAEITEAKELELKVDSVPAWFVNSVLHKLSQH